MVDIVIDDVEPVESVFQRRFSVVSVGKTNLQVNDRIASREVAEIVNVGHVRVVQVVCGGVMHQNVFTFK